jgi:hypothetical protein
MLNWVSRSGFLSSCSTGRVGDIGNGLVGVGAVRVMFVFGSMLIRTGLRTRSWPSAVAP